VWVEFEREKATVGDDNLFFVDDSTGCPALDAAQGAGAGLSTFLSFLMGTVTALQVEFQLETQPNSSEGSVEGFCNLRGEEVVQEQENRLGMRGMGRPR